MAGRFSERTISGNLCQDWDEYFMTIALASSKLSRNPYTQVGACIVDNNQCLISLGYNGAPRRPYEDKFFWYTGPKDYNLRHIYALPHAEVSALYNRSISNIRGCTMYVTLFPCNYCAMKIVEHGITKVFYLWDKNYDRKKIIHTKMIFDLANVIYRPVNRMITINYDNFQTN